MYQYIKNVIKKEISNIKLILLSWILCFLIYIFYTFDIQRIIIETIHTLRNFRNENFIIGTLLYSHFSSVLVPCIIKYFKYHNKNLHKTYILFAIFTVPRSILTSYLYILYNYLFDGNKAFYSIIAQFLFEYTIYANVSLMVSLTPYYILHMKFDFEAIKNEKNRKSTIKKLHLKNYILYILLWSPISLLIYFINLDLQFIFVSVFDVVIKLIFILKNE